MQPGTILLINGTSSSGKTSIVKALQKASPHPLLDAGLDRFLWMLPSRFLDRPLWDEVLGMADHAGQPGHDLVLAMHHAIAALAQSGWCVAADHVLVEPLWAADCAQVFAPFHTYFIGVRCPLAVLEERERNRKDRTLGQAKLQFERVHAFAPRYDLEVDTSLLTPTECAETILAHVEQGQPPSALRSMQDHRQA